MKHLISVFVLGITLFMPNIYGDNNNHPLLLAQRDCIPSGQYCGAPKGKDSCKKCCAGKGGHVCVFGIMPQSCCN